MSFAAAVSNETIRRVRRTFLQALASGAFTSVAVAGLGGSKKEILIAFAGAMGTVLATYAQNVMEDTGGVKDRRI